MPPRLKRCIAFTEARAYQRGMSDVLIVIPARHASVRFPGKPLARIGDKPLIQWTWEAAIRAADLGEVLVATDDARIADAVHGFGGAAEMTSMTARNGTERCAEIAALRPEIGRAHV